MREPDELGVLVELAKEAFYRILYVLACVFIGILFPVRTSGSRCVPRTGGLLILSNHQSYLDPVLIGLIVCRRMCCLARSSLFRFTLFRWLILALDTIKIEREGVAKEGLKESLRRLKNGKVLVIWPEGTRTRTGKLGELQPGILLLLRRSKTPVLLVGISGGFECWPRHQILPWPKPIWIHLELWQGRTEDSESERLDDLQRSMQRVVNQSDRNRDRLPLEYRL